MPMPKASRSSLLYSTWLVSMILLISYSKQLQSSVIQTLLTIQKILQFPMALDGVRNTVDFCGLPPSPSLTVVFHENTLTELHIVGKTSSPPVNATFSASYQTLSPSFSIDSLFITLTKLYSLRAMSLLSLVIWGPLSSKLDLLSSLEMLNISSNFIYGSIPYELSRLRKLQRFILDDNMLNGNVPDSFSAFPDLEFLSLKENRLSGHLTPSLSSVQALRVLVLSCNDLSGDFPDLSVMPNLQVLILEGNKLGTSFPILGNGLVRVSLRKNRFNGCIPSYLKTLNQLQDLDVSCNCLGRTLPPNISCRNNLGFTDISANYLIGELPSCLMPKSSQRTVKFARNCLVTNVQLQWDSYCFQAAEAADVSKEDPRTDKKKNILIGIMGATLGGVAGLVLRVVLVLLRKSRYKKEIKKNQSRKLVT